MVRAYETQGIRAVGVFPAGTFPQVAINDKKMYPIYAKCVELGIPVFCCAGIPGPRLKSACQHVELIDEVMYDFPELDLRHSPRLRALDRARGEAHAEVARPALLHQRLRPQVLPPGR